MVGPLKQGLRHFFIASTIEDNLSMNVRVIGPLKQGLRQNLLPSHVHYILYLVRVVGPLKQGLRRVFHSL